MNIFLRELKASRKAFLFWTLGLFFLVFAGMTKYTGVAMDGASLNQLLARFPRVVLAVLGISGVDVETPGGYYAVLAFYAVICASLYGASLGAGAVNREAVDKTYEFLFTRPRSRAAILSMKLAAGVVFLLLFSGLNYLFSVAAIAVLKLDADIGRAVALFSLSIFLVGLFFFSLSACLCAAARRPEKGALYGNLCFLAAFLAGVVCDMLDTPGALRLLSPLKYFLPSDLLAGKLDFAYLLLILGASAALLAAAFLRFGKKDLNAVS
ncbi:MAG: ABC transporter permease subunit [Oscillospiraceae bacterium]|nr:ABC transporter permease subunit [Oscillospiraceae bacterium]